MRSRKSIGRICVFAGKTTLADCLVASNGIISSRLAGKVSDFICKFDSYVVGNHSCCEKLQFQFYHQFKNILFVICHYSSVELFC